MSEIILPNWLQTYNGPYVPVPADSYPFTSGEQWRYIYALVEPDTGLIRYIGKSIRPKERLQNHLNEKSSCHRTNWIASLKKRGLVPDLLIIEANRGAWPWQEAERFWIKFGHDNGWPLVNQTSGGDGVPDLSGESRERLATTWVGRKHRPETIEKLRLRGAERRASVETRAKMSASQQGREITWGDALSKALRKFTPEEAATVKQRLDNGEKTMELAAEYKVDRTTISKIKMGTYANRYRLPKDEK